MSPSVAQMPQSVQSTWTFPPLLTSTPFIIKFAAVPGFPLVAKSASAHYIFNTLIAGSKSSTKAVRKPQSNSPVHDYLSSDVTCNVNPSPADETVTAAAGSTIGFKVDQALYHNGSVAIYLGKAPTNVENWDGSGKNWFEIGEWGATFNPFSFLSLNKNEFTTTLPKNIPDGEYLVRIEQIALHLTGTPEFFMSCAQIKVTGGGTGSPSTVSIPGYIQANDPGITVNIYDNPTSYTVPGPAIYSG